MLCTYPYSLYIDSSLWPTLNSFAVDLNAFYKNVELDFLLEKLIYS